MSLQDIITKYKIDEADASEISGLIQAEKDKGISEHKKKTAENSKLMADKNRLRDLLKNNLELDPDGELEEQITAIKEKLQKSGDNAADDGKGNAEIEKLRKEMKATVERLQKSADDERVKKEAVEARLRNSRIKEVLDKAMSDIFIGKELVIKDFIREGKVKLTDDDNVVFVDGDDEIDLAKGIESFRKNNSDLVRNNQVPGSGGGSRVVTDGKGKKAMAEADWKTMNGKDQRAFIAEGGQLT